MAIIYHGDYFGTKKLDPRLMLHEKSDNWFGIGIYFTSFIYAAKQYGPYICSINTNGLNIIRYTKNIIRSVDKEKIENFNNYLLSKNLVNEYSVQQFLRYDDLIRKRKIGKDFSVGSWQRMIARYIFLETPNKFEEFVYAWNKFIKIDGLYITPQEKTSLGIGSIYADRRYDEYCIIQTKVKVTPVNF